MKCNLQTASWSSTDQRIFPKITVRDLQSVKRRRVQCTVVCSTMNSRTTPSKILICGGGIIGTSIAYYLSERDVPSTIIEKRAIAGAASGKAAGFLVSEWNKNTHIGELSSLSFSLHKKLAERFGAKIDFRHVTPLGVASTDAAVRSTTNGLPPWLNGNVCGFQKIGDEDDCAQVHPYKLTNAMLEAAMEKGTKVVNGAMEGLEWNDLTTKSRTAKGVIVSGEFMEADVIVLAMGPWTKQASQWLPVPAISGQKYHSILVKPKEPISAHVVFLNHLATTGQQLEPEIYPRPDGEVYICGEPQSLTIPDDPDDVHVETELCNNIHKTASVVSSYLKESEVCKGQSCFLPLSPDGVPIIGKVPQTDNVYIATGHSCWGILNAPATGLIMSEMILDGSSSSLNALVFDPKRFTSLQT